MSKPLFKMPVISNGKIVQTFGDLMKIIEDATKDRFYFQQGRDINGPVSRYIELRRAGPPVNFAAACHSSLFQHNNVTGVLNYINYEGGGLYDEEDVDCFIEWLVKYSPFRSEILIDDPEFVKQTKFLPCSTFGPFPLGMSLQIISRHPYEEPGLVSILGKLIKAGMEHNKAYITALMLERKQDGIRPRDIIRATHGRPIPDGVKDSMLKDFLNGHLRWCSQEDPSSIYKGKRRTGGNYNASSIFRNYPGKDIGVELFEELENLFVGGWVDDPFLKGRKNPFHVTKTAPDIVKDASDILEKYK